MASWQLCHKFWRCQAGAPASLAGLAIQRVALVRWRMGISVQSIVEDASMSRIDVQDGGEVSMHSGESKGAIPAQFDHLGSRLSWLLQV
jgi:hypothetical protein